MRKYVLLLVLLVAGLSLAFAGGGGGEGAGVKNITWQVWITPNLTRAFYDEVVQAFEKKNPTIKVGIAEANAANLANADDFIKTRLAAGDVPDLWWNIGTPATYADSGLLWKIPANDPDLKKVKNLMNSAYKGTLYSFQRIIQPLGLIFYNKALWKQAGLSATPASWADYEAACAKASAAGLTPIVTGGEWVAGMTFNTYVMPEVFHNDTTWNTDRWAGKTHFTDDVWVESTGFYKGLVDKGYFNKGALSLGYEALEQAFLGGKAVMYPMGSWFSAAEAAATKDFEVGVFFAPTKSGAAHLMQTLNFGEWAIYAKSKNPEAAYKLAKFYIADPVYGAKALQADGLYSNLQPPLSYSMSPLQKAIMDLVAKAVTTSGMYDTNVGMQPPAGIADEYNTFGQQILAGKVSDVREALKQLDAFWDKAPKP